MVLASFGPIVAVLLAACSAALEVVTTLPLAGHLYPLEMVAVAGRVSNVPVGEVPHFTSRWVRQDLTPHPCLCTKTGTELPILNVYLNGLRSYRLSDPNAWSEMETDTDSGSRHAQFRFNIRFTAFIPILVSHFSNVEGGNTSNVPVALRVEAQTEDGAGASTPDVVVWAAVPAPTVSPHRAQ
jgi:hypothetical protein